jgi:hypothetical protein
MDRMANAVIRNSERAELKRIRASASRRGSGGGGKASKDGDDDEDDHDDGDASSSASSSSTQSADWLLRAMGMQPSSSGSASGTGWSEGTIFSVFVHFHHTNATSFLGSSFRDISHEGSTTFILF